MLSEYLHSPPDLSVFEPFRGRNSIVIGNGPELASQIESLDSGTTIVAGSAIVKFYRKLGAPDIIVTDLDDDYGLTGKCASEGSVVLIHAHGDNIPLIQKLKLPENSRAVGTCQCGPAPNTMNFGGFTDGDRAAFFADYLDSPKIELVGFDFEDAGNEPAERRKIKLKKLRMAKYLIGVLKESRSQKYGNDNIVIL